MAVAGTGEPGRDSPATAIGRTVTVTESRRPAGLTNGYSRVTPIRYVSTEVGL
jgi:hypothetical protein